MFRSYQHLIGNAPLGSLAAPLQGRVESTGRLASRSGITVSQLFQRQGPPPGSLTGLPLCLRGRFQGHAPASRLLAWVSACLARKCTQPGLQCLLNPVLGRPLSGRGPSPNSVQQQQQQQLLARARLQARAEQQAHREREREKALFAARTGMQEQLDQLMLESPRHSFRGTQSAAGEVQILILCET